MALSDVKIMEYMKRLLLSRMRILSTNGFYGILLMHMIFTIDEDCETAYTDGDRICFSPDFLEDLTDHDLDIVLMHEILHVVLRHCIRGCEYDNDLFNYACDIVVNSNIKHSLNDSDDDIRLSKFGVGMHLTPNGEEGYHFTAEEVYIKIVNVAVASGKWKYGKDGSVIPSFESNNAGGAGDNGENNSIKSNGSHSEGESGSSSGNGKKEKGSENNKNPDGFDSNPSIWDDHSKWKETENDEDRDLWVKRFEDAVRTIEIRESIMNRGLLPEFARRMIGELRAPKTDWRRLLNNFVQEDICDYSFSPPDRRYEDSDFFLPDFNEKEFIVKNILFMVDTSGSVSDNLLTQAMSEIKGAIDQFGGKLEGKIGFFDAGIIEPQPFTSVEDFYGIKAAGGGGTDFDEIFKYIDKYMRDDLPSCLIILTDGYAPFPDEKKAMGIPVLWLINNYNVTPPWGKVARIIDDQ